MPGNLSQRITKKSHMIHTDGCQYSHRRIPDHICRIQSATHADFQYHQITVLFHKIKKCNGSLHLEHGRMLSAFYQKLVSCSLHLLCQPDQIFSGNIGFINLDPFPVTEDRWRNISSYFISGFLQNRRYICQHRTLPIGSCNMHKSQLILRISKQAQQIPDRFYTEFTRIPIAVCKICFCFFICHVCHTFICLLSNNPEPHSQKPESLSV